MASEAGTVLRHGWIYGIANMVNRAAGILLLPLYTLVLTPTEFGIYALVGVVGDLLAVMLMIGMNNAFTVVYLEQADDGGRRRVVSTAVLALGGAVAALVALAWPAGWAASRVVFGDGAHAGLMALALGSVAVTALFELGLAYLRACKRSGACLAVSFVKAAALLALNALFLLGLGLTVEGIFLANAAAFLLLGLGLAAAMLRANGLGFSGPVLKKLVRLGLPYLPQSLLDIANNFVMRWLLNALLTTAAVGLFSFGMRLAVLLYMLLTASFLQIWSVRRLETRHGGGDPAQARLVFHLFVVLLAAAAAGMVLVGPELVWLAASPDYAPVIGCLPLLVLAYVLHGIRMHPEVDLMKAQRMAVLPWISAAALVVGTVLAVVLVSVWGLMGAALANLGRELFQVTVTESVRRHLCPDDEPLQIGRLAAILLPGMAAAAAGMLLFGDMVTPAITAAKVGLTVLFVLAAVLGPGIGAEGRAILFPLLGGLVRRPQSV